MQTLTVPSPPAYTARYLVPSRTEPGIRYTVEVDTAGRWSCDCPARQYPKTRGRCWHLKACQAGIIAPSVRVASTTHATMHAASPITLIETPAERVNRLMYA